MSNIAKIYREDCITLLRMMNGSYAFVECQKNKYENILCYIFTAEKIIL